jgi:hypothetical protein
MKKITTISGLLTLSAILLLHSSCEKEKPLSEAIIGKWEVKSEQRIFYLQNVKKFESTYYYEAEELAFEFTGGGSIIVYEDGQSVGMLNYTLNGNTITIETGSTDWEWESVSADGNTLTWKETGTDTLDEVTYNVEIIFTAGKI